MAIEGPVGGNGQLFIGEDKTLNLTVLDTVGVPVNIAGWTIHFVVRKKDNSPDPALLDKTATIGGTYNADPTINTQKASVQLTAADTNSLVKAQTIRQSWKRTDLSTNTILYAGDFIIEKATAA